MAFHLHFLITTAQLGCKENRHRRVTQTEQGLLNLNCTLYLLHLYDKAMDKTNKIQIQTELPTKCIKTSYRHL